MNIEHKYWFPAKRFGWGWGLPVRWQGWACLAVYVVGIALVLHFFGPGREPGLRMAGLGLLTLALFVMFWLKGERPGWRWGKK